MKTINYGDVYSLKSPLEGLDDASLKSLSYMMGSVSNRPVVVIRPPAKWDRFGMVTVISSLSKMGPAYHTDCEDVYGFERDQCNFNWYCQHPYTIPVARLHRKIGTLDVEELKNLLYTVHWLHDPFMQMDPNNPVPAGYEPDTLNTYTVTRTDTNKERNVIHLDQNYRITKSSDHSLEGKSIIPAQDASNEEFRHQIDHIHFRNAAGSNMPIMPTYGDIEHIMPAEHEVTEEKVTPISYDEVQKLKDYGITHAEEVAALYKNGKMMFNEYNIMAAQNRPFRARFVLGDTEAEKELKEYTEDVMNRIWEMYEECTNTDIFAVVPDMPTREISKVYHVVLRIASAFKKLCTVARDLNQDAYDTRRKQYEEENGIEHEEPVIPETTRGATDTGTPTYNTAIPDYKVEPISDPEEINNRLMALEGYLNYDNLSKINDVEEMRMFLSIPIYAIKDAYHGNSFMKAYATAVKRYKTILANVK